MESTDIEVLRNCAQWFSDGYRCELITVIRTWGSSPRPEGSMMALRDDGMVVGSVSGGCIEDDLIDHTRRYGITRITPEIVKYGITADDAHKFGLPCGGTIELAIEPVSSKSRFPELLACLETRHRVARTLNLATGDVTYSAAAAEMSLQVSESLLTTIHGPRWRLLIIGAGSLSRFVAQIAVALDYDVTVCDPREEYRVNWGLPRVNVVHDMPDDVVTSMHIDARCAVVALTHDPKLDDLALIEALKSEAFYIGAIGSRANNEKRRQRLKLFDLTAEQLTRLRGPIGIYIGSKTPNEIAISILAELTAAKNQVALPESVRIAVAKADRPPAEGSHCSTVAPVAA